MWDVCGDPPRKGRGLRGAGQTDALSTSAKSSLGGDAGTQETDTPGFCPGAATHKVALDCEGLSEAQLGPADPFSAQPCSGCLSSDKLWASVSPSAVQGG